MLPNNSSTIQEVTVIDIPWTQPLIDYILHQTLPHDTTEQERIMRRSKSYTVIGDHLYQRSARSGVLMKCVSQAEGVDIFK
jgi:hypothetical protein